ncbi:MAG: GNAT family N-acetyltransferase [Chloroflexota bacterium]
MSGDQTAAGDRVRVRRIPTGDLTKLEIAAIRDVLWSAFDDEDGGMREVDWQHALGGMHFVLDIDGRILAHASVVEREIHVADLPLRAGYVEAVATAPREQGRGLGSLVMVDAGRYIGEQFELGVLGTGRHAFYERLGWSTWRGPSGVRTPDGVRPTPDEDGFILVLRTATSPSLDFSARITCDSREGDVW